MNRFLAFLLLALVGAGCDATDPGEEAAPVRGIYVANQGNFSDNNGSLTVYEPESGLTFTVLDDVGTLVQSLTLTDTRAYVVANTAGAIDILDLDFEINERIGRIAEVPSPRYLTLVEPAKAYVSNLFAGTVTVLDVGARRAVGTIEVGANPEDIAVVGGRAYVANSGFGAGTTLTVIDLATDTAVETIDVGCDGPRHLEVDGEGELWVFCLGNTVFNDDFTAIISQTNGAVVVLDGASGAEIARFPLGVQPGSAAVGQDAYLSAETEEVFLIDGTEVFVFDTAANAAAGTLALGGEAPLGGLAYDATAERFYAARVPDFTSAGFVTIHDRAGQEVGRFDAGVAPAHVALLGPR